MRDRREDKLRGAKAAERGLPYNFKWRSLSYSTTCGAALLILRFIAIIGHFPLKRRRS